MGQVDEVLQDPSSVEHRWVNKSAPTINAKAQFGEDVEEAHTQLGLTGMTQNYRGETSPHAFWGS